jgi:hypothetical protein
MAVFGISDLHLSHRADKPMDAFGDHWVDHAARVAAAWDARVGPSDLVLVPGDLSWASKLEAADLDLAWLGARPGTKVICRGNHDYWWHAIGRVRAALPAGCLAVQNDAVEVAGHVVCGSRLWAAPGTLDFSVDDQVIFDREVTRLGLSLRAARRVAGARPLLVMVHYPPFTARGEPTAFSRLICGSGAALCAYGHLHGEAAHRTAVEGVVDGTSFHLVACDKVGFAPKLLLA